jgi:hypothetical protein
LPNGVKNILRAPAEPGKNSRRARHARREGVARESGRWCYADAMTTDTDIQLSGPFKASDSSGRSHDVKAVRIFDEGYGIIDVYVDFAAPLEGGLYKDKVLVGNIIDRLRALGYVGPNFSHSDPGLQDRKLIVLEAPEEFSAFAKLKGWKNLAEEFDDE